MPKRKAKLKQERTRVLRPSKQPPRGDRGDKEWCVFCQRLIAKERLAEHEKLKTSRERERAWEAQT